MKNENYDDVVCWYRHHKRTSLFSSDFNAIICLVVLIRYGSLILPIHACVCMLFLHSIALFFLSSFFFVIIFFLLSLSFARSFVHIDRVTFFTYSWMIGGKENLVGTYKLKEILFWTTTKTRKSSGWSNFFFCLTKKFQQDIHANTHA